MGRKRKQPDPVVVTKASLPPCRVCGAPGAGFHYGVNTCEACKGFFHRSLKIWAQYTCDKDSNCTIEHGSKKLCQHCRYKKCLSVGMAKEAIKTGRYSSTKRTKDILEIKQLEQHVSTISQSIHRKLHQNVIHLDRSNDIPLGSGTRLCSNRLNPVYSGHTVQCDIISSDSLSHSNDVNLSSEAVARLDVTVEATVKEHSSRYLNHICPGEEQMSELLLNHSNATLVPKDRHCLNDKNPHLLHPSQQLEEVSATIRSPSFGSLSDVSMTSPPPLVPRSQTAEIRSVCSTPDHSAVTPSHLLWSSPTSPSTSLLSPASLASSPVSSIMSSPTQQPPNFQTSVLDSPQPVLDQGLDSISEIYSDRDRIVKILIEADENSLLPLYGQLTDQEIRQQQSEHIETCRLRREMFGPLSKLPDHEYDYIFMTTGLDTDDRQKRLHIMGDCLEKMIRAMVKFCKAIPGFSKLDNIDKLKLIKYSRQEFYMFISYKFFDSEKKVLRGFDNQWKCEYELSMVRQEPEASNHLETLNVYFRFCKSLQDLKLSYEELVVIRALIVMAPDRDNPVDSPLAQEIYWQLTLCLLHVLSYRHPNPLPVYAKIVDRLTEARTQTEGVNSFLKQLIIDKYSDMMENPLLREMCGGIFFDYSGYDQSFL